MTAGDELISLALINNLDENAGQEFVKLLADSPFIKENSNEIWKSNN